jgi:hypothetical protein
MRFSRKKLLLLAVSGVFTSGVMAFSTLSGKWSSPRTTFHVSIPGVAPTGQTWSSAFIAAMSEWSTLTAFTFDLDETPVDPCAGYSRGGRGFPSGNGDARNSAGFRSNVCGNDFGNNVLAITLTFTAPGTLGFDYILESDIIFNSNFSWDIYSGPNRFTREFGRVALHELGHALGLDHETTATSIMAPMVGDIDTLQPDDIAGANFLYGVSGECNFGSININSQVDDALKDGDCRIMDLWGGSDDISYVDVYTFTLEQDSYVDIQMKSAELDSVLIITDRFLGDPLIFDDFNGGCDARVAQTLPAGEYLLMANTYVVPEKCVGNVGGYAITMTDTTLPILGAVVNTNANAQITPMLFSGGASVDGANFRTSFSAQEFIDVEAQVAPDPAHVGLPGSLYVLATLSNGQQFVKNSAGEFVLFDGNLAHLVPYRQGNLSTLEKISIVENLRGAGTNLAGLSFWVHVGYATASAPSDIYYNSTPVHFSIATN